MTITATNHGPDPAPLHLVPQLWFRNTWAWGRDDRIPTLTVLHRPDVDEQTHVAVLADHAALGRYVLSADGVPGTDGSTRLPELLLCDNESDSESLWGVPNRSAHPKDAVDRAVVRGDRSALATDGPGTKAAFHYRWDAVAPGESVTVRLRLAAGPLVDRPFSTADAVVADRHADANAFYDLVIPAGVPAEDRLTARRAFAGLLWTRQLYRYDVEEWLQGDPNSPTPSAGAAGARARRPEHLVAQRRPRRRHLDAGRVGVPLVRDLGPRLPRRRPVARRPRLREVAAAAALPGMGPASERPAPRLRVGVLRREPARARVGRLAGLPARRRLGQGLPHPDPHQAVAQRLLVGEPQGLRGVRPVRGRLPRDGQHRGLRPVEVGARRAGASSSPTPRRGSRSSACR